MLGPTQVVPALAIIVGVLAWWLFGTYAESSTTDFMAFLASRPSATLPLGGGDLLVALQSSVSKQVPGNTYGQVAASNTWTKSNAVTSVPLTPGAGTIAVNAATRRLYRQLYR